MKNAALTLTGMALYGTALDLFYYSENAQWPPTYWLTPFCYVAAIALWVIVWRRRGPKD
jgi:hypothetical protein